MCTRFVRIRYLLTSEEKATLAFRNIFFHVYLIKKSTLTTTRTMASNNYINIYPTTTPSNTSPNTPEDIFLTQDVFRNQEVLATVDKLELEILRHSTTLEPEDKKEGDTTQKDEELSDSQMLETTLTA
nr:uncharacterized protein LOC124809161 isoform X2 [Hydra vulgaris]XP_047142481.1 uncharacterized protein LOC124816812 [Hydra vulgaris]